MTESPSLDVRPRNRSDELRLAVVSSRDGRRDIYLLDVASRGVTRLANHPEADHCPNWHSLGKFCFAIGEPHGADYRLRYAVP